VQVYKASEFFAIVENYIGDKTSGIVDAINNVATTNEYKAKSNIQKVSQFFKQHKNSFLKHL